MVINLYKDKIVQKEKYSIKRTINVFSVKIKAKLHFIMNKLMM